MIRVSTNFDLKSNIPLDNRLSFETENDMLGIEPLDIYYGAITHVKKSNKTYMYVATEFDVHSNPTKGKWVQIFENAKPIVTAESVKYETGKESDGTPIYGKNTQQVLDSLQNDFKNSIAGNKWKEPVNNESDLKSLNPAPVQGEVRYVIGKGIYMFNGANWISVVDTIPLANTTKSGLMSANDKVKVDKINISPTASNEYFGKDGNYHDVTSLDVVTTSANGIMSSADKAKLDKVPTFSVTGSTSKFLNEQGQFVTISGTGSSTVYPNATQTSDGLMSASDKVKLDAYPSVSPTGDASKVLNEQGQFVTITGSGLTKDQTDKINKIQISTDPNADSLYLGKDGNYHDVTSLDVVTTSTNGIMSSADKAKLDGISIDKTSGSTSKFLNEQGQFTTVIATLNASDQAKLDKIITSGDGSLVLSNNGNYVALPTLATQIKDGLMSSADKTKLDGISIDKTSGSTSKFLNEQGQFVTITGSGLTTDQADKINKIQISTDPNADSLYLGKDGNYHDVTSLDVVTTSANGIMLSADKTKLDALPSLPLAGATGSKFLNDLGQFTTVSAVLNASDQAKLDKIITSGDGSLVLSNNGNYVALPTLVTQTKDGLMSANDKKKLDSYGSLPAGATGSKFLNDLGQFTAVTATLNSSDQAKLDKIITTGDGSLVLSNNGNYVALPGLVTQVKDGLMSSADKTKLDGILIDKASGSTVKFLNEQGNFTDFVVDAKNVNYNPPAGSRLTATTVQGAFDEVLDKVSNIDDSAATTSTTSTYSISKINDLLRSKSNTGHNHSVTDITDLTANYYTQAQVDSKIKNAANAMIWQPPVNEIADLATTYPNPENGWTVIVQNENSFYRYNGTTWVNFGTMQFNSLATSSENGLMSSTDKIKLDKIDENAPRIYYSSTEPPRVNGNIWVVD